MGFYRWRQDDLILSIYVQPKASKDEVVGLYGESLKIRITAPPIDGKANKYLIGFLAKWFEVRKDQVELLQGELGREKTFLIKKPKKIDERFLNKP